MAAQVDPKELQPGQWVNDWLIVRRLSGGAYGVVYEVEKEGRRFALKVACERDQSGDPLKVDARSKREAASLQQLNHPHIIRIWGHGRWPDPHSGFLYIVLDFVDGYTLGEWAEKTHPTPHEAVVLFMKLFDALEHMHGRGVFHRDLSLRNIMVTKAGEPVIIDFGAADYATAEELTDGPVPPCTPRNRSPEATRFWEANRFDPKARYTFKATDDIFALGANLYDVLTDPTPTHVKRRPPLGSAMIAPPSPLRESKGRVPAELSAYAMMLIRQEPNERPATAKDARRPLEDFARCESPEWRSHTLHPVAAQLPPEPAEAVPEPLAAEVAAQDRPRWWRRRHRAAGLLALGVLITVAVWMWTRPRPPTIPLAEKPTSRPAQLPSPDPTQQEASPSVPQPQNSPTLTSGVPAPLKFQKTSPRRVPSKAAQCALLVASAAWLEAGCTGVQTRPDPEPCPAKAIQAMEQELGWDTDGGTQLKIIVDVTKGGYPESHGKEEYNQAVFRDGPVTGALSKPDGKARQGMLMDGHVWATGDRIYVRYVRAHLPDQRIVPICVELTSGGDVGLDKEEGSKPGAAMGQRESYSHVVRQWR